MRLAGFEIETPPAAPIPGEAYALGVAPSGAWAGQAGMLAVWQQDGWLFVTPQPGWRAWGVAEQELRLWDGSAWGRPPLQGDTLSKLGIGTSADSTNRLAVSASATLFSHDGAGHQLKINKSDPSETASLLFQSDWSGRAELGLAGNNDLSIKVSADGSTWTQALRIDANGNLGLGETTPLGRVHIKTTSTSQSSAYIESASVGYTGDVLRVVSARTASNTYDLMALFSGAGDREFQLRGDGNGYCDGSWTGGGADYAEYFEWADGNPKAEDRRGISVILEGAKIRPAATGEAPIGVISANPSIVGDGDMDRWKGKYLRDDFGAYLWEDYTVLAWQKAGENHSYATGFLPEGLTVPRDATRNIQQRRKLNPAYDPSRLYVPRAKRAEWDMVGLMGKLRLRRGQPVAPTWIRMRQVANNLEDWLLR
ncbi:MAG: hypothetical protein COB16_11610 [Rhodobacteraceae bacterium]|nr:MAG: hypothetical protein COB16_11610 [Paracoccaceae bacterium]